MKLGLMLQVGGGALEGGKTPRWPDLRDMALAAEAVGFDALFVPDHLLFRQSPTDNAIQVEMPAGKTRGAWEAWTVLCALAARSRVSSSVRLSLATASETRRCSPRWRSPWMK